MTESDESVFDDDVDYDLWRDRLARAVDNADTSIATRALLGLTMNEADPQEMFEYLVRVALDHKDWQVSALAITCLGHTARIYRVLDADLVLPALRRLRLRTAPGYPFEFAARVENALDDIEGYTGAHPSSRDWWALTLVFTWRDLRHRRLRSVWYRLLGAFRRPPRAART
ncbi:hypothetical protein [Antribacter gilvus]|uniref:hypothetical protein n=1 Tax=Antribacter gilvus TaxID=2304675 RepID=UPI000F7AB987|nr:hypothetical protein [Antribacter gilvus]